jgi:hypothetical protein
MAKSYLDKTGLALVWAKIKELMTGKVDKVDGKGLSTNDYTTEEKTKLAGVSTGAQVNVLEGIQKNGETITPVNKIANISVPTKTSDITNDSGYITNSDVPNGFGNVKVGTTTIEADAKKDTLNIVAGSDKVTITADASTDTITIDASGAVTGVKGDSETTYRTGDVNITKANIGLGNVDNTSDANKEVKNAATLKTARTIDGVSFNGSANIIHYGSCSTAAATTAKAVSCTGFTLATGAWIAVKFTVTNTGAVANLTLNVNSTGAKAIKYRGGNLPSTSTLTANRTYLFVYDGTNYELVGDLDTNSTYTAASATPLMDGTAAVGSSAKYAREDHVHPSDTSRVPTTRKINNKALSADITLSASDVSAIPTSAKGAANGVCPLNANSVIDSQYLPSFVDDIVEAYARSGATALSADWLSTTASGSALTPETGKIYVLMADSGDYAANTQFRWSGSAYVKLNDGGVSPITNEEINTICV